MSHTLHTDVLKTLMVSYQSRGSQSVVKRQSKGSQDALVFSLKSDLRRSLRDGVFLFAAFGYPRCCYRHLPTWVRDTSILAFCGDCENFVGYETPGATDAQS
jgi:hypothetical protein